MFILDTDSITYDQRAHPLLSTKVRSRPRGQLFTASVTVEEQFKGRLACINKHRNSASNASQGHAALIQAILYFSQWNILLLDERADAIFRQLQKRRIRIGSQDLRIAAVALLHGFIVVTSNAADFIQMPHLSVADWTTSP